MGLFGGSSRKDEEKGVGSSWSDNIVAPKEPFSAARQWLPAVGSTLFALGALHVYSTYLRRIPGTAWIRPGAFRTRSLYGRVTRVGDGDNFHLYHTPGGRLAGWGWLRHVPQERNKLKDKTVPIRLAGVDAPECAHFGKPAQPLSGEALRWLSDFLLHKNVRAYIHKNDQYNRVVATVFLRRWGFLRHYDVGQEMLKRGLATTYEAKSGVEFGGREELYRRTEAKAKAQKLGVWGLKKKDFESPRDYKQRTTRKS